jgi:UDP-glucuronate decarboxylase
MRYLVAGGAGFLGSHLCKRLLLENHEVVCVDNLYTGSLTNISIFESEKNFHFIDHDICKPLEIRNLDGIFNFACPASPVAYQKNPIQTLKTSIIGSSILLDLAKQTNARILQASTSEVYGDPLISPQSEQYWGNVNPIGIRACYDEGKRAAETLFIDSFRMNQSKVQIARIFNTYGPNMSFNDGRVVSNFIVQALLNEPLTVYGDGTHVRSFCFVDDLIEGVLKLFGQTSFIGPVNLGNPESISMLDLAKEIIEITSSKSEIIFRDLPSDDPKIRIPDISKAKRELIWEPKISRSKGLRETVEFFKEAMRQEVHPQQD